MRRRPQAPSALAGFLTALPLLLGDAAAAAAPPLDVRRHVLENGLVVLLVPGGAPGLVSLGMMYGVGSRNETAGFTGLAHYNEHMNFRATRRFPGSESTEGVTRVGGHWNGYTWIDQTFYQATLPKDSLDRALDVERDRMTDALYLPEDFREERTSVIAELRSYDDPHALLYDEVLAASFTLHPYRNNTIGDLTDVLAVTRDEAFRFYRRYYHPNNAVLVLGGDLDPDSTLAKVRARFATLPAAGDSTLVRSVEPPQTGERRVTVGKSGPNAEVLVAFRAPALADADFPALVLFDALLAGGKGLRFLHEYQPPPGAPLAKRLLAGGKASVVRTAFQASRYPYVYTLRADVAAAAALAAAEHELFAAVAEAAERHYSDAELQRARREVRAGCAEDLDTVAGRVHQLAFFEVAGGYRHLLELEDRLEQVTREDLARFAREHLRPSQATVGWFVPTEGVPAFATGPAEPEPAARASEPPVATERSGRAVTGSSPPTGEPGQAAPSSFQLGNGARILVTPQLASGLVAIRGRLEAGSGYDGARPGLAALLAALLALPLEGDAPLAASFDADPGAGGYARYVSFGMLALPDELSAALRSLAARLLRAQHPSSADVAAATRAAQARAQAATASVEGALLARALGELHPAGSPLALPPWGDPDSFSRLPPAELLAFLGRYVDPARLELSLAGALDPEHARRQLEPTLGGLAGHAGGSRGRPELKAPHGPPSYRQLALLRPDKTQNSILVAWPGDRSRPFDASATRLLLYLLGETHYAGRLGRALVGPGLVYSVDAALAEAPGFPGLLMVRTAAARKDTAEVLRRIRAVLEEAARGSFGSAELSEAKTYLLGKTLRERDGAVGAAELALTPAAGPPPASITLEQLNDTARRLLARGAPLALVAGPGE